MKLAYLLTETPFIIIRLIKTVDQISVSNKVAKLSYLLNASMRYKSISMRIFKRLSVSNLERA